MKHTLKEIELNNGAKGLLIHVPGVEVVRILAEFRAGFDLNSWDKYELPHVVEHMMFTNETYPAPRQSSWSVRQWKYQTCSRRSPTGSVLDPSSTECR